METKTKLTYSDIEKVAVEKFINGRNGFSAGCDACYGSLEGVWYAAVWHVATQRTIGVLDCENKRQAAEIAHKMACGNSSL